MPKSMTLRLADETAAELEAIARTDGVPVSEAIRSAIDAHIDRRRRDAQFQERLRQRMKSDREVLERLAR